MQGLSRQERGSRSRSADRGPDAGGGASPAGRIRISPVAVLAVVALCYAAAQLLLVSPRFALEWDEAVYASQFSGNGAPIAFHASRGWGTPLLVAPVVALTDSITVLRVYLTGVSALLLFVSFRLWLPLRPGYAVPVAAALFAGCWPAVFYGDEAMPNVPTALGAVALTALALRAATARGVPAGTAVTVAGTVVVVSLFRPTDVTVIALTLAGALAFLLLSPARRRGTLIAIAALGTGLAAGWGLWTADALRRYGGVAERLEKATENFGEYRWLGGQHLRALDGPVVCSSQDTCGPVPVAGAVWLAVFLLLAAAGLASARRRERTAAGRGDGLTVLAVPVVVAAGIAGAYLYYPSLTLPRYMLPAYGLLSIAAAAGLLRSAGALRRRTAPAYAVACCCVVVGGHLWVQASQLLDNVGRLMPGRARDVTVAADLRRLGHGRPCLVYGWHAPQIGHYLGCEAAGTPGGEPLPATPRHVAAKAADGYAVIVVYKDDADRGAPDLASWPRHRLPASGWYARVNNGEIDTGVPPGRPYDEPGL
ncbi:hypothetical protein [Planobispora takensis]|uniref:Uncharacterized protein n=1 Tax=Planobispora takensis TaxID=1367882 RepID=A0A8J3T2U9_9ACTN|nr:hypothetical protein [Planobispora takensis]GII03258.1 hypothetical protein Pta02_52660 [Planobispora takensis]